MLILLCFVPLFGAFHANKISFLVLLDICVWLVAVVSFFYVVKAPIELYFLVKAANRDRTRRISAPENNILLDVDGQQRSATDSGLSVLETRLLFTCIGTLPLALGGWLALEEICSRNKLHTLSETIHPYFVILLVAAAASGPILEFYGTMKKEVMSACSGSDRDLKDLHRLNEALEALTQRLDSHVQVTDHHIKRIVSEIKGLKKMTRCACEGASLDSRLVNLENQLELVELMMKERSDVSRNRSLLEMLVPNPLRMFSTKGLDSSIFQDEALHSGEPTK